jgi:hypothetical protein
MVWETKRHEEEMVALKNQITSLNAEFTTTSQERADKDTKLIELDHLVGQLLSVNETLIAQVSGTRISSIKAATTGNGTGTGTKVLKKKKSFVPRAARMSTASCDAKTEAGSARRRAVSANKGLAASKSMVDEGQQGNKELLGMHEMYVSLANSITGRTGKVSKISGSGSGSKIKKSVGKSSKETPMRRRIIKQQQQREEEEENNNSLLTSSYTTDVGLQEFEKKYMTPSAPHSTPSPSSMLATSTLSSPSPGLNQPELRALINSLEEEFEGLNAQYQRILTLSNGKKSEDTSQELVSVIQRLHKKGEQLRALKSPTH